MSKPQLSPASDLIGEWELAGGNPRLQIKPQNMIEVEVWFVTFGLCAKVTS